MECSNCFSKTEVSVCPQCFKEVEDWKDLYEKEITTLKDELENMTDETKNLISLYDEAQDKLRRRNMQIKDLKAQIERLGRAKDIEV